MADGGGDRTSASAGSRDPRGSITRRESGGGVPETDPLEVVASLGEREEGDQDPGLDLGHPLLGLLLVAVLQKRRRRLQRGLRPAAHRRRSLTAGECLEPRLQLPAHSRRRRGRRAPAGSPVRVVEPLRPRRRLRVPVAPVVVAASSPGRRPRARLTVPVRPRRPQRHVLNLVHTKKTKSNPDSYNGSEEA